MANFIEDWKERMQRTDEKRTKLIELNILAMTANIIAFDIATTKNIAFLSPTFAFAFSSYLLIGGIFSFGGVKYNILPNFKIALKRIVCGEKKSFLPMFKVDNRIATIHDLKESAIEEAKEGWGPRLYLFTFVDFIAVILTVLGLLTFVLSFMPAFQCLVDPNITGCVVPKP